MKNVQAQFQMLDSYVKEYELNTKSKIPKNKKITANGEVQFRIINIEEKQDILLGEIELLNNLDLIVEEEVKAQIKIKMRGLFSYTDKTKKEEFEHMLKINGSTTLSNFIRTYIYTNTSISGMQPIITPMINFIEFFKENQE